MTRNLFLSCCNRKYQPNSLIDIGPSAKTPTRRYDPAEEDPLRTKYIILQDEDGALHFEDLTVDIPPTRASESDVTFYLYTQQNPDNPFVIPGVNFGAVAGSPFDPRRKNIFISHGWNNHYLSGVNTNVRGAALRVADVNVFVVDWSGPANRFYTTAFSAAPTVGRIEGNFINYLIDTYRLTPKDFKLVGHSLGAHVAGCAGAAVNGLVDSIVGLDPAGPLYSLSNTDNRLDPSDGETVHIIHTNSGFLGFSSSIGDADYFPNGGSSQSGCGLDLIGTCAHSRAHQYYAESILTSNFQSVLCDSYSNFNNGRCSSNARSILGELAVDKQ